MFRHRLPSVRTEGRRRTHSLSHTRCTSTCARVHIFRTNELKRSKEGIYLRLDMISWILSSYMVQWQVQRPRCWLPPVWCSSLITQRARWKRRVDWISLLALEMSKKRLKRLPGKGSWRRRAGFKASAEEEKNPPQHLNPRLRCHHPPQLWRLLLDKAKNTEEYVLYTINHSWTVPIRHSL